MISKNNKPYFLKNAKQLPWQGKYTPHCVLDISRKCNIKCRACYNDDKAKFKPLKEIESELKQIMKLRRLQTVLLLGGEPLLHPELIEIIKMVRSYGFFVETCSNGVLLDKNYAKRLKEAGLNILAFHIESHQIRPDIEKNSTKEQRNKLRKEKCDIAANAGIETGLMLTAFKDNIAEIEECVEFVLNSKNAHYLTVTSFVDTAGMGKMKGNIDTKIISENKNYIQSKLSFSAKELIEIIGKYFNNTVFHFIGTKKQPNNPRWFMFRSLCTIDDKGNLENFPMKVSFAESLYMACYKLFKGSSIFYAPQTNELVHQHFFFNALLGNFKNLIYYFKNRKKKFINKIIMATVEADIDRNGEVDICASCFDAQLRMGKLVPTCLVDNIIEV